MTLFIDADGCPVVDIAVRVAKQTGIECIIICDTSHAYEKEGARTITVSQGNDSVCYCQVKNRPHYLNEKPTTSSEKGSVFR